MTRAMTGTPRPTKESVRELLDSFAEAAHVFAQQPHVSYSKAAAQSGGEYVEARNVLLSAVDALIDERDSVSSGDCVSVPRSEIERVLANRSLPDYMHDLVAGWLGDAP